MLIQCITFVKIHCITCITLNYCLTETFPLGYRLYCRELGIWIILYKELYLQLFPFTISFCSVCSCKDCFEHATGTVKLVSKGCLIYKQSVTSNPRRNNISTGLVEMYLGSVEKIFYSTYVKCFYL